MKIIFILFIFALVFVAPQPIIAQSLHDSLNQYVAEMLKNPNDVTLRKKIFFLAQTIKPEPTLPEEARKNFVMGKTLFEEAKTKEDYELVIQKFKQAISFAPWYSEAYKQLGITQELAGYYDEAISSIGFYMLSALSETDKQKAQDEIYIIEAKKEKANSPQTLKKNELDDFSAFLLKNEGAIFDNEVVHGGWGEIVIDKGSILQGERHTDEGWLKMNPNDRDKLCRTHRYTFKQFTENVFEDEFYGASSLDASGKRMYRIWTFSKDGRTITVNYQSYDNKRYDIIYKRVN